MEMKKGIYLKSLTCMAILAAIMVSLGQPFYGNVIWSISNPLFAWHNRKIGQREQFILFIGFWIITLFGVINLWPF